MRLEHGICYESCDDYYIYKGGETYRIIPPVHLELWIPILKEHGLDVLWFTPSPLSRSISWDDFDKVDRDRNKVFPTRPTNDTKPTFVSIRKKSDKFEKDFYLAFPENAEWSANDKGKWYLQSPVALAETIYYLSLEMDCDVIWGAGNIGMQLLKRDLARKGRFRNTELTDELRNILNNVVSRPIWKRHDGLRDEQKEMRYVHGYDKNSQYLGAAQSCFLGAGQPKRVYADETDLTKIGFWHYRLNSIEYSEFDGYDLPCPIEIQSKAGWNGEGWASSDLLMAARRAKVDFEILEGYIWPTGAKFLESWARQMYQHRVNFRNKDKYPGQIARENAAGTAKLAANNMMGRLAQPGGELYKPDWNIEIVHKAIANQFYSFKSWLDKYGICPALVCTDSFWIISDEPDPAQAIPGILDFQDQQRGYHTIGSCRMTEPIIDLFDLANPESINNFLKQEVGRYVESI